MIEYQKLYKLPKWLNAVFISVASAYGVFTAFFCVVRIWIAAAAVLIALLVITAFFLYYGALQYVCFNGGYVKYKDTEYSWSDVKITVAGIPAGRGVRFLILFCDVFLFGKDVKKAVRKGFWVNCTQKNFSAVTRCYDNRISLVMYGESVSDIPDKNVKKAVEEHNARFFERANLASDGSAEKGGAENAKRG